VQLLLAARKEFYFDAFMSFLTPSARKETNNGLVCETECPPILLPDNESTFYCADQYRIPIYDKDVSASGAVLFPKNNCGRLDHATNKQIDSHVQTKVEHQHYMRAAIIIWPLGHRNKMIDCLLNYGSKLTEHSFNKTTSDVEDFEDGHGEYGISDVLEVLSLYVVATIRDITA